MKFRILSCVALAVLFSCAGLSARAADDDGSLNSELTTNLQTSVKLDRASQALRNALTGTDAKKLAVNRTVVQGHNNVFNHKVKTKGVTNQQKSGRCWLFAALNAMRPAVIEKYKLDGFEFSVNHLAFWDKLEKANFFLETVIELRDRDTLDRELDYFMKSPIPDGGWWSYAAVLIEKYGVMPKEAMAESYSSENTAVMNDVLTTKLRIDAMKLRRMAAEEKSVKELRNAKCEMLQDIYRILVMNYGRPPAEFTYRFVDKDKKVGELKTYTPKSFYKECVGNDLDQYVHICDDPTQPYGKHYRLRRVSNMVGSPEVDYVNVPIDVLKSIAVKSLIDGQPVTFAADARRDMDRTDGIMQVGLFDYGAIYGIDLAISKADRLTTREGAANHAMTFIGIDIQNDKPAKWLVENSWGKSRGQNGLWTMYDRWFNLHVYSINVKKAYVPNSVLKVFQEEPVELPAWTPMNSFVN